MFHKMYCSFGPYKGTFQPLRLNNVDENIAREIDEDLTKEYDKEEIMRKIFWKARSRAKEELTKQLTDFQQKRKAGLGTIYGPTDNELKVRFDIVSDDRFYKKNVAGTLQ